MTESTKLLRNVLCRKRKNVNKNVTKNITQNFSNYKNCFKPCSYSFQSLKGTLTLSSKVNPRASRSKPLCFPLSIIFCLKSKKT